MKARKPRKGPSSRPRAVKKPNASAARITAALQSAPWLVALIEKKRWIPNAAFEALYSPFLPTSPSELIPDARRAEFERLLENVRSSRVSVQAILEIGPANRCASYDCLLIYVGRGGVLLLAAPLSMSDETAVNTIEQLKAELQEVKRRLENKEKELQAVLAQVDEVRYTDPLTYLPNRRYIISELQREVMRSERYNTPLSVSMIDLDHFKRINDTYGHSAGDQVLRSVAMQLRDHIRLPDIIGRYGGEEFLVLLPNSTAAAAGEQAARLCQQVRSTPIPLNDQTLRITVSIGIAQYRTGEDTWQTLLDRADQAMYRAKQNGRDRWVIIEPADASEGE